jgi:hypothetical protein
MKKDRKVKAISGSRAERGALYPGHVHSRESETQSRGGCRYHRPSAALSGTAIQ